MILMIFAGMLYMPLAVFAMEKEDDEAATPTV